MSAYWHDFLEGMPLAFEPKPEQRYFSWQEDGDLLIEVPQPLDHAR